MHENTIKLFSFLIGLQLVTRMPHVMHNLTNQLLRNLQWWCVLSRQWLLLSENAVTSPPIYSSRCPPPQNS